VRASMTKREQLANLVRVDFVQSHSEYLIIVYFGSTFSLFTYF
jgi:hypothetical protein